MSSRAFQPNSPATPILKVVGGPLTGLSFDINKNSLSIGRSSENDVVLKGDSKTSRQHAVIRMTNQGYSIESLNQNNPVYINGQPVAVAILPTGTKLIMGETEFLFQLPLLAENELETFGTDDHFASSASSAIPSIPAASAGPPAKRAKRKRNASRTKKKSPMFNIILGVVVLAAVYLFTTETENKSPATSITTAKDIEADIKAAKKIQQDQELAARKNNKKSAQYKEAQAAYLKGFRDYEKGLYSRAKDSFQTCLTLYPQHVLCKRYYGLSNRKLDEIVQYSLRLGKDHRERNQFKACMNSMRNVMVMVRNKSDKRFQQAKAHYDACKSLLGDGF